MCALFRAMGFWVGRLNAKIDLKSSEIAGNESKINKRNNNFDNNFNCSLFLISIRHMIKKKPPRISETKSQKVGAKAHSVSPLAQCLLCTLYWTYVSLSLCDRCQWIRFSVEEFNFWINRQFLGIVASSRRAFFLFFRALFSSRRSD